MDNVYLEDWERYFYKNKLIECMPQHEDMIKDLNDIDLMNIYNSDDWLAMIQSYR